MKLINLTGRPFSLHDTEGKLIEIAPDPRYVGLVAVGDHRTVKEESGHTFSFNVRRIRGVKGMPAPDDEDAIYVVPMEVAMALQEERDDVVYLAEDSEVRSVDGTPQRISHLRRTVRAESVSQS